MLIYYNDGSIEKVDSWKSVANNLYRADLTKVNLRTLNLHDICISQSNLSESNLSGKNLSESQFDICDFENSNLSQCNLVGTNFQSCDLRGVNFNNADMRRASFELCRFDTFVVLQMYGHQFIVVGNHVYPNYGIDTEFGNERFHIRNINSFMVDYAISWSIDDIGLNNIIRIIKLVHSLDREG